MPLLGQPRISHAAKRPLEGGNGKERISRANQKSTPEKKGKQYHTVELLEPSLDALERRAAGNVVDNEGTNGAAVVGGSDRAKALLASSVPDLGLNLPAIDIQALCLKFHPDCRLGIYVELVPRIPRQQVRFPYS
ncbi:hypothetical protein M5K25_025178 [Dendrobium thyrsiflorum]|uniref:Uncharacterized protein n=1 Tax=Dendrobium thyrsiflorum TaxID=117978 RepID=A0ABD0U3Y2_DENTH